MQCSASIISEEWLLTAAHCLKCSTCSKDPAAYSVVAGLLDTGADNVNDHLDAVYTAAQIVVHENYSTTLDANNASSPGVFNDIALVRVSRPFKFTPSLQPIKLSDSLADPLKGVDVYVAGWGFTTSDYNLQDLLNWVTVTAVATAGSKTCGNYSAQFGSSTFK
eukprot:SM004703S16933  [mRNA]  locus=s4703:55:1087:+ [translate_table: standard]